MTFALPCGCMDPYLAWLEEAELSALHLYPLKVFARIGAVAADSKCNLIFVLQVAPPRSSAIRPNCRRPCKSPRPRRCGKRLVGIEGG